MLVLVALGGNALLRRGKTLSAAAQQAAIATAASVLAQVVAAGHRLIITHGNGPQVGLLALQSAAGPPESAMPLDVLGAESEGWIGYSIELALRNALPEGASVVTLLTQTLVDPADKSFDKPTKPIGPVYDEARAKALAAANNWAIAPEEQNFRRVVASPKPLGIIEIASIKRLTHEGTIVICAGGGGIPVARLADGKLAGIEAVIDKDATSALLAEQAGADLFIMLSDVPGVYLNYGDKNQLLIGNTDAAAIGGNTFAAGSMGPKVAAACAFARATGHKACIGALADLPEIVLSRKGTIISRSPPAAGQLADGQGKPDRRRIRRRRVIKAATLFFGFSGSSIDCGILDESPYGMLVDTSVMVPVPDQLAIRLDDGPMSHVIRRWALGTKIGLELVGPQVVDMPTRVRMKSILEILDAHGLAAALAILNAARFFDNAELREAAEEAGGGMAKLRIVLEGAAPGVTPPARAG